VSQAEDYQNLNEDSPSINEDSPSINEEFKSQVENDLELKIERFMQRASFVDLAEYGINENDSLEKGFEKIIKSCSIFVRARTTLNDM